MTVDEIRSEIAKLCGELHRDEGGTRLPGQPQEERINELVEELNRRGAACFFCAFGIWDKHERCTHP